MADTEDLSGAAAALSVDDPAGEKYEPLSFPDVRVSAIKKKFEEEAGEHKRLPLKRVHVLLFTEEERKEYECVRACDRKPNTTAHSVHGVPHVPDSRPGYVVFYALRVLASYPAALTLGMKTCKPLVKIARTRCHGKMSKSS